MEDVRSQLGGARCSPVATEKQVRDLRGCLDSLSISLNTAVADTLQERVQQLERKVETGERRVSQLQANCQQMAHGQGEVIEGLAKRVERLASEVAEDGRPWGQQAWSQPDEQVGALTRRLDGVTAELQEEKDGLRALALSLEKERREREDACVPWAEVQQLRAELQAGRQEDGALRGTLQTKFEEGLAAFALSLEKERREREDTCAQWEELQRLRAELVACREEDGALHCARQSKAEELHGSLQSKVDEFGRAIADLATGVAADRAHSAYLEGELRTLTETVRERDDASRAGAAEATTAREAFEGRLKERMEAAHASIDARMEALECSTKEQVQMLRSVVDARLEALDDGAKEQLQLVRTVLDTRLEALDGGTKEQIQMVRSMVETRLEAGIEAHREVIDELSVRLMRQHDALRDAMDQAVGREAEARDEAVEALKRRFAELAARPEKEVAAEAERDTVVDGLVARVSAQATRLSALDDRLTAAAEQEARTKRHVAELAGQVRAVEANQGRRAQEASRRMEQVQDAVEERLATVEGFFDALRDSVRYRGRLSEPAA